MSLAFQQLCLKQRKPLAINQELINADLFEKVKDSIEKRFLQVFSWGPKNIERLF